MEVLNNIPVKLECNEVLKNLRLRRENRCIEEGVRDLLEIVIPIAKPKAVYQISYVSNKKDNALDIDGVRFTSNILRVNLDKVGRVFPYVVTSGQELEQITLPPEPLIKNYLLDFIKGVVVTSALHYLEGYVIDRYRIKKISRMGPGSLQDWPITQQRELFSIFGDVEALIDVRLTENCQMIPLKSVSGIFFPTEIPFVNCQLCTREACCDRKVPYEPELVETYRKWGRKNQHTEQPSCNRLR